MNANEKEIPIMIWSHISCNLIYKLRYEYKYIYKDILVDENEWSDVIEDQRNILQKMKKL